MHPTIDLTCCCKKDLEVNLKIILFPSFLTDAFFKVFIGDLAQHDAALKVEKS